MGYKDKKYTKSITQQINDRLTKMLHDGEGVSKREARANGTDRDKIHSYSTYENYYKHCKYFSKYLKDNHPEITNLKQAKKYVNEWLQYRVDNGNDKGEPLSAWTISLERQALCKLFGIDKDDPDFFKVPKRKRENIKRSRGNAARDKHFSELNNEEFIEFCRGTGCRRQIMEKLEGRDLISAEELMTMIQDIGSKSELDSSSFEYFCNIIKTQTSTYLDLPSFLKLSYVKLRKESGLSPKEINKLTSMIEALSNFPDHEYFINHRSDKGGRYRYAPIIGEHKQQIIDRMRATAPNEKVWLHVPGNADVHGYRSDYATMLYKKYARSIDQIPYDKVKKGTGIRYQSEVYACRKDEKGKKLDKKAMFKASKALGHNRLDVVANNYIRGI